MFFILSQAMGERQHYESPRRIEPWTFTFPLYFITELKTHHLSYFTYLHDAIHITDPNMSHTNLITGLAHHRLSVAKW